MRLLHSLLLMPMIFPMGAALAQDTLRDDVPLAAYLDALAKIAPAARVGAEAYMQAFERRCARPLKVIELRSAIANGTGDPVLMTMIHAASRHDTAALQRLSATISCKKGREP